MFCSEAGTANTCRAGSYEFSSSRASVEENNHNVSNASRRRSAQSAASMFSSRRSADDYEMREQLGEGASSQVRRAVCRETGRHVALKVLPLGRADSGGTTGSSAADVAQEYDVQRRLSGARELRSSIVGTHAGYLEDDKVTLVMDIMEGGSLDAVRCPLPEADVRRVMRQLLTALAGLHKRKVIHCDIKLANLLLERPGDFGSVRLSDFGLSHKQKRGGLAATASGLQAVGTPLYFAPEMIGIYLGTGCAEFGAEVDVWAAGVVMYELLCGWKPFAGHDTASLFARIASQRPSTRDPPWDTISEEAKELVHLCLAKEKRERITAAQALKHRWFQDGDGDGTLGGSGVVGQGTGDCCPCPWQRLWRRRTGDRADGCTEKRPEAKESEPDNSAAALTQKL
eukprot:jgi/Tetstr1/436033/TSEL_024912.t1